MPQPDPRDRKARRGSSGGLMTGVGLGCVMVIVVMIVALFLLGQCVARLGLSTEDDKSEQGPAGPESYAIPEPSPNLIVRRRPATQHEADMDLFLARSLSVSEATWTRIFSSFGEQYRPVQVVIFKSPTILTACGRVRVQAGPFYCPDDETIYIETGFFDALAEAGGGGDFPMGLVLAHEVGHHVQKQRGLLAEAARQIQGAPPALANRVLVGVELQADCYAGLWTDEMNRGQHLDPGDIEEGLAASQAIGDDVLQSRTFGEVDPSQFTHGTAAQRMAWFMQGFEGQDVRICERALCGGMPPDPTHGKVPAK